MQYMIICHHMSSILIIVIMFLFAIYQTNISHSRKKYLEYPTILREIGWCFPDLLDHDRPSFNELEEFLPLSLLLRLEGCGVCRGPAASAPFFHPMKRLFDAEKRLRALVSCLNFSKNSNHFFTNMKYVSTFPFSWVRDRQVEVRTKGPRQKRNWNK